MKKSYHDLMEQSRRKAEEEGHKYPHARKRRVTNKPRIALGKSQAVS